MEVGGRSMAGIGETVLDDDSARGGVPEAQAISRPRNAGGELLGISMRDAQFDSPPVVGGTFVAPAMLSPSIDRATMIGNAPSGGWFAVTTRVIFPPARQKIAEIHAPSSNFLFQFETIYNILRRSTTFSMQS